MIDSMRDVQLDIFHKDATDKKRAMMLDHCQEKVVVVKKYKVTKRPSSG